MFLPFEKLPVSARLWVHQASRNLTTNESAAALAALRPALDTWAAHGHPLMASATIRDNRFLVVAVDEDAGLPSGCSIDSSVHSVQAVGKQLGLDFMDRSAAYRATDRSVHSLPLMAIRAAVADGVLTPDTLVYNTLVKTKGELQTNWLLPASATWLKRYFANAPVY